MPRFGREDTGKESQVASTSKRLPRRRASIVRVAFHDDSSDSEQHSQTFHSQTATSSSAKLLRLTSKAGIRSLETSSDPSLRSVSNALQGARGSLVRPRNSFRSKAPRPLKLDEKPALLNIEQPPSSREATSPYEEQFRRRRGDLLHRLGPSVPYMHAYDPTSLQCDALTTRLLGYLCEPGTPCFYKFKNKSTMTTILDLGCGPQLRWAVGAASFWPNAKIIGVDCIRPNIDVQVPGNVEFLEQNFLNGLPAIKTESVDFVRMSCLGTSIPKAEWPIVLAEVRRVLKTGGAIEIVDDELARVYPKYSPKEFGAPELRERTSRPSTESSDYSDDLHPIDRYFKQMLVERYGMSETPHKTIDTAMEIIFGANDKKHFRVELPSPNYKIVENEETRRGGNLFHALRGKKDHCQPAPHDTPAKAQRILGLDSSTSGGERINEPFLILYPHGLCRMDASEVRMAARGSMHKVLSCRASLIDFIVGPGAEGEELDEVTSMLWGYERFYEKMLNLPDDDWNDFIGEQKESGREMPTVYRTSSDSHDSGYSSQSSGTVKMGRGKKRSTSYTTDNSDSTLVRCFRVFHATKV